MKLQLTRPLVTLEKNTTLCIRTRKADLMRTRDDFGSLYLTAKRSVYMLHEEILKELNA
jgi:hypothetical protein